MLTRWLEALDCTVEAVDEQQGVRARSESGIPFWCTVLDVDTGGVAEVKAFAWTALYRPTEQSKAHPERLWRLMNTFMQTNLPSIYLDADGDVRVEWTNFAGGNEMMTFIAACAHFVQSLEELEQQEGAAELLCRAA